MNFTKFWDTSNFHWSLIKPQILLPRNNLQLLFDFIDCEKIVRSLFFKLVKVTAADADHITAAVLGSFEKACIPTDNIIGFIVDMTNVMFGSHHLVVTLLKVTVPNLFTMKCLCHSAHLCASHACEKLPRTVEDMVRDTYSYFSHSAEVGWVC